MKFELVAKLLFLLLLFVVIKIFYIEEAKSI